MQLEYLSGVWYMVPSTSRSDRRRLRIIPDGLVELPQLELIEIALGNLADNAGGLACNDGEAGNHHVRGHNGAVEDAHIVFDNGELVDDGIMTNVNVGADGGSLDDGALADKDVVADSQGHVGKGAKERERER